LYWNLSFITLDILVEQAKKPLNNELEQGAKNIEAKEASSNSDNKDAYIITNQSDPNCTHKIQMMFMKNATVEKNGTPNKAENGANGTDDLERFEIVENNTFETVGGGSSKEQEQAETVTITPTSAN